MFVQPSGISIDDAKSIDVEKEDVKIERQNQKSDFDFTSSFFTSSLFTFSKLHLTRNFPNIRERLADPLSHILRRSGFDTQWAFIACIAQDLQALLPNDCYILQQIQMRC